MSKIHWEHDLVERPFCEQLKAMGWEWIEGDQPGLMTDRLIGRVRCRQHFCGLPVDNS